MPVLVNTPSDNCTRQAFFSLSAISGNIPGMGCHTQFFSDVETRRAIDIPLCGLKKLDFFEKFALPDTILLGLVSLFAVSARR
jgi:hypothetical protein